MFKDLAETFIPAKVSHLRPIQTEVNLVHTSTESPKKQTAPTAKEDTQTTSPIRIELKERLRDDSNHMQDIQKQLSCQMQQMQDMFAAKLKKIK